MFDVALNSRETAFLIWAGLILLSAVAMSRGNVLSIFSRDTMQALLLLLGFFAYVLGLIILSNQLGLWRASLAFGALFWACAGGLPLLVRCVERDTAKIRNTALRIISATALIEVLVNLKTFPLPVELALFPLTAFLAMITAFVSSARRRDLEPARRFADTSLTVIGFILLVYVALSILIDPSGFDAVGGVSEALMPVVLTAATVPYLSATWAYSLHTNRRADKRLRRYRLAG